MDIDVARPAHIQQAMGSLSIVDKKGIIDMPKSLQELIIKLREIFADDVINVEYVQDLMTRFTCNSKEWKKFAKFDPHRYTRNLVDEGNGKYNLMLLCWNEGQGSSIHSHADSHCFMKILDGQVQEELYDWPGEGEGEHYMMPKSLKQYSKGAVQYINDSLGLHRIENPSHSDPLITLHLYSPPYGECSTFDKRTGKSRSACVTFWSKYGKRTAWSKVEAAVYEHSLTKK